MVWSRSRWHLRFTSCSTGKCKQIGFSGEVFCCGCLNHPFKIRTNFCFFILTFHSDKRFWDLKKKAEYIDRAPSTIRLNTAFKKHKNKNAAWLYKMCPVQSQTVLLRCSCLTVVMVRGASNLKNHKVSEGALDHHQNKVVMSCLFLL